MAPCCFRCFRCPCPRSPVQKKTVIPDSFVICTLSGSPTGPRLGVLSVQQAFNLPASFKNFAFQLVTLAHIMHISNASGSASMVSQTQGKMSRTRSAFGSQFSVPCSLFPVPWTGRASTRTYTGTARKLDRLADQLATEMILPADCVRLLAGGTASIGQMARLFDVSARAMELRLQRLGIGSSVLFA